MTFDYLIDRLGIKSVVNLQKPGEHASCSLTPLHSSGFAYDPVVVMNSGSKLITNAHPMVSFNQSKGIWFLNLFFFVFIN
jgi:hypothetical protein